MDKLNNIDAAKSGSMEDIIHDAQKQADDDADADKSGSSPRRRWKTSTLTSSPPPARKPRSSSSPTSSSSRPSRTAPATSTSNLSKRWSACATAWTARLLDVHPAAQADAARPRLPPQDHEQPGHRRAPPPAGRPHARQGRRQGLRPARLLSPHRPRRESRAPRARQIQPLRQHGQARHGPGHLRRSSRAPWTPRTA